MVVKLVYLLYRRADMSVEAFRKYWNEDHIPIAKKLPGLRRYVQSHALVAGDGQSPPACDGVTEMWWDDEEAMQQALVSPEAEAAFADAENFMDVSRSEVFFVAEHEIV